MLLPPPDVASGFEDTLPDTSRYPVDGRDSSAPASAEMQWERAPARARRLPALAELEAFDATQFDRQTVTGDPRASRSEPLGEGDKMLRRFEAGDYTGALILAETLLTTNPDDERAQHCAESCHRHLTEMYLSRLGGRSPRAPNRPVADQMPRLALDHRAGFLLSCIDGKRSIDELPDMSGMPPLDAVRILYELVQEGAVEAGAPRAKPTQR